MSKRDLKKYLDGLEKEQIAEQLLELYDKFSPVKTYYDFIFNPKEDKLVGEAKAKIANEYFPVKSRRAKLRRSTAQKYIKHFLTLGVDAHSVADVMLFNIETAQKYAAGRTILFGAFYKSMFNSFEQAVQFIVSNRIVDDFNARLQAISKEAARQRWQNEEEFPRLLETLHWA